MELQPLPLGLAAQSWRLLGPSGAPLAGVALRLVDASGALALPLGRTDAEGLLAMPEQPELDPLLLWRVETVDEPGGLRAAWLPWPRRSLQQAEPRDLDQAAALVALALAPRWAAWGRLNHEAQGPFAEWVAKDLAELVGLLRPALAQLSGEERARLGAALMPGAFRGDEAPLRRVVPEGGPVAAAVANLGNRLANATLHAALDGGPTLTMAAQLALPFGAAEVPAVGDGVLDEVDPVALPAPSSGGGGGGGVALAPTPPPSLPEPQGSAGVSLGFLPKAGALVAPAQAEGASTAGPLPALTGGTP